MSNQESKYIVARDPKASNFCYFPFFEILMTAEGKFKPCSKHDEFVTHGGEVLTVENGSIELAWNSDYMKQLRENFHNDVKSPGCRECWRQQEMGLKEMRYDSYHYPIPESQVDNPAAPMRVEINASNICNLRCRICMPTAAHKWIDEARELYGVEETIHFNMTPDNIAQVREWVPNLIEIGFFGGEPLRAEENIDLMRYCVESGHAKNIDILVNTNGTVYTDEIVALFKEFKHVFLNFSIDDIGKRFEYQRKGANWEKVVSNIRNYISHGGFTPGDAIECKVCCSVTNMNIYYFPEYFKFFNENFPGLPVFWNLIYEPREYSVEILPDPVKDIIRDRLEHHVSTTYEMTDWRTKTIQDLITFLDNSIDLDFSEFFRKVQLHDEYRDEDFKSVFPELWKLIEQYRPAMLTYRKVGKPVNPDFEAQYKSGLAELLETIGQRSIPEFINLSDVAELTPVIFRLLRLASKSFGYAPESTEIRLDLLLQLMSSPYFDKKRFLENVLTHGISKVCHRINQNEADLLREEVFRMYTLPEETATK